MAATVILACGALAAPAQASRGRGEIAAVPIPGVMAFAEARAVLAPEQTQPPPILIAATAEVTEVVIARVQRFLATQGFNPGPVDGRIGRRTRNAIRGFQKSQGLPSTGLIDDELIIQVDRLRGRMSAESIMAVQAFLEEEGYDSGGADGDIGPRTRAAIRSFQRDRGLRPTGELDDAFFAAMYRQKGILTQELVSQVQVFLTQRGYNPGPIDGAMGPRTRNAIRAFQEDEGMIATGRLSDEFFRRMDRFQSVPGGDRTTTSTTGSIDLSLIAAAGDGQLNTVRSLLDRGANVNAQAENGATAIVLAAQNGHPEVVDLLIRRGADVNARVFNGATPIIMAAQGGHADIVRMLLDAGAQINARGNNGTTALMVSSYVGNIGVVRQLLERGADVRPKHESGRNAADLALLQGNLDVFRLLQDYGATPAQQPVPSTANPTRLR